MIQIQPDMEVWSKHSPEAITLQQLDWKNLRVVAAVLGQSVALDYYARSAGRRLPSSDCPAFMKALAVNITCKNQLLVHQILLSGEGRAPAKESCEVFAMQNASFVRRRSVESMLETFCDMNLEMARTGNFSTQIGKEQLLRLVAHNNVILVRACRRPNLSADPDLAMALALACSIACL